MAARVFIWISTGGGAWAIAANWDDVTDGVSPSTLVPGSQDSVTVTGPAGISVTALSGNASLAAAQFAGNVILSGNVTATTLTAGLSTTGGLLQLAAGSTLQTGTATLAGGSLLVNGTTTQFGVAGQLTLGSASAGSYPAAADLSVTAGGHAAVLGVLMRTANSQIYVDPASIMEIGTLGTGGKGKLTIDTGYILLGQGSANQYGAIVDNGNLYAFGGTLAVGSVTGFGHLGLSANATMLLDGTVGAGEQVIFAGPNTTLQIAAEAYTPQGTITGFAAGDAIDYRGSLISAAIYNASGSNAGVLTLYYGTQVAAQLTLSGNYSTSTFLTAGDGSNGTLIDVAAAIAGSGTASPGTSAPDVYAWTAAGSGAWGNAANWQDQTSGASPATIAPGANNVVDIAVSQTAFTVIAGPANAASLSLTGEAALTGTFAIGTLSIGTVAGTSFTDGGLDLLAGAVIRAQAAAIGAGAISSAGSGALLSIAGTLSMGGGETGVGLPVTALTATAGGRIQAAGLIIGGGSGNSITTDPAGAVEFGTLGNAGAGAVSVDAGASITGNGSINPFGSVVDNGSITASGGVLVLGSVTGTGVLAIGNGALELTYATSLPIAFTSANATLAIGGPAAFPTGTLTGIVPGDVIDLLGSPLTGVQYAAGTMSPGGTLALIYNGVTIGKLSAGPFTKITFVTTPDGQTGTDVDFLVASGGSTGSGQTGTDPLVWTGAANGNWAIAVNWSDSVTGKAATLPPGTQTAAVITGGSGANFQSISGTGTSASLVLNGNGFFFGNFTTSSLSVGQDATAAAAATPGTLVTTVLTTFTLGTCLIADGAFLAAGTKTQVDVAGTLAVSDGGIASVLSFTQKATGQVGALSLGGGSVSVDPYSSLEVGVLGGAATGLLTIDPGALASGYGTLDQLGTIALNGIVQASGGTLVLGAASGIGTLVVATEAALGLTAATAVPIAMTGAGATLILKGAAARANGVISGFLPGDSIVTSNTPVDSVSYQPGAANLGTLTLSEAGQVVDTLSLAGNYAGDSFAVQPAGAGAAVIVTASAGGGVVAGGPPAGTVTPDQYVWTGIDGVLWADAKNWIDTTQSGTAAAAASPGQNDLVTIAVPAGGAEQVSGPANAAVLTTIGSLALVGSYGIGTLAIGTAQRNGVLAMGAGSSIAAAAAAVIGGIAGQGGTLSVGGTLTLGQASLAGLVSATGTTAISAAAIVLRGAGSAVLTDGTATVEVGGQAAATPGSVSIDSAGTLTGAGVVNPAGQIVDNGLATASGGTLTLGSVSGSGTLLVGVAAAMVIEGAVAAGLTVDFAAGGTLTLAGGAAGFAGGIADFGPGDQILLPVSGATQADYVLTGPGLGVLTIYAGNQVLATLTLLGSQVDYVFSVAGSAGGGTILTATPSNMAGEGGSTVGNYPSVSGGFVITPATLYALAPLTAQTYLQALNNGPPHYNGGDYEYFLAGDTTVVGPPLYSTIGEEGLDAEVIGPLTGEVAPGGFGPGTNMVLQAGYNVLLAEGTEPINLIDQLVGDSLLISNDGSDILSTFANNDTLVGAVGANTVFYASGGQNVVIQGGGDDTITTTDNAQITTSDEQSEVFLGAATNTVTSDGADEIVSANIGISDDVVTSDAAAGSPADTVFGPLFGSLVYNGGAAPGIIVGGGGQIVVNGGSGNGTAVWAGSSFVQYNGGAGSAVVVGGTQGLYVQGGTGPETVFGGTSATVIEGTPGNSVYVVGLGPATISAAIGNAVWVLGSAQVSVAGAAGVVVYAGMSSAGHVFQANAGTEVFWGGEGNDSFYAGTGNGTFVSDGGADIFNFTDNIGGGHDEIVGFVSGLDTISLHGYGAAAPQLSVQNGSTFFTLSDGTNVELYNVTNLTAASFNMT